MTQSKAHDFPAQDGRRWTEEFVARISRNILNSLAAATAFGDLLVDELPAGDARRDLAEKINESAQVAKYLVLMLRNPDLWRDSSVNYLHVARAHSRADLQSDAA